MSGIFKIASLKKLESDAIRGYGFGIGTQMQDTIKMIGQFLDYLKDKSFRYSMFQELSSEFAQVQTPKPKP